MPHDSAGPAPGSTRYRKVDLGVIAFHAKASPVKFQAALDAAKAKVKALGLKGKGRVAKKPDSASSNLNVRSLMDFIKSVPQVDKKGDEESQKQQKAQQTTLLNVVATLSAFVDE